MYDATLLTKVMGLPTTYSSAPITRSVRLLFKDRAAIEPYKEKRTFKQENKTKLQKDALCESLRIVLKMVNRGRPVTGVSAAAETKWTRNHCSILLTRLYQMGLVKRYKDKGNHTRWYVYTKKETA